MNERIIKYAKSFQVNIFTGTPVKFGRFAFFISRSTPAASKTIAKLSNAVQLIKSVGFERKKIIINNLSKKNLPSLPLLHVIYVEFVREIISITAFRCQIPR